MVQLKKGLDLKLKMMCEEMGYRKKGWVYAKPITEDIASTIWFNTSSFAVPGHIFTAPFFGVRYERVENILRSVTEKSERHPAMSTHDVHIGYLMPENTWKEWDYSEVQDIDCDSIRFAIETYGSAFIDTYSKVENLIGYFEKGGICQLNANGMNHLPILYYLQGKKHDGLEYIHMVIKKLSWGSSFFFHIISNNMRSCRNV